MLRLCFLMICALVSGCASKTTVFIYGKYLTSDQQQALTASLNAKELLVEINQFDFPASVTDNTIVYSLMLKDASVIERVEESVVHSGFTIDRTQALTEGNHWYTKDSVALFLFPAGEQKANLIFAADLPGVFKSEGCNGIRQLELRADGSYTFSGSEFAVSATGSMSGKWRYRQFPYLELQPSDSEVADHYFQLSRSSARDQISHISFINADVLSSYLMPDGCRLRKGLRE